MEAGLLGQAGDNARDPTERDITDAKTVLYEPASWIWRKEMHGRISTAQELYP